MEGTSNQDVVELGGDGDSSLSLSISLSLPDNTRPAALQQGPPSSEEEKDSISEHMSLSEGSSVERDRSYQELEISHLPLNFSNGFSQIHLDKEEEELVRISQEACPQSLNTSLTSDATVKSILEEILGNELFKSQEEAPIISDLNEENSIDLFANVDLDDKSLKNYRTNLNFNQNAANIAVIDEKITSDNAKKRIYDLEEIVSLKDATIEALNTELDSLKELRSNPPSSFSVGTASTEYKQLQEELLQNKTNEYQTAMEKKNNLIHQLTESLQQSVKNREELNQQAENFKRQIIELQNQLEETTALIREEQQMKSVSRDQADNRNEIGGQQNSLNSPALEQDLSSNNEDQIIVKHTLLSNNSDAASKIAELKKLHEAEIKLIKESHDLYKKDAEIEKKRLRDLLAAVRCGSTEIMEFKEELEAQHTKELEELRKYFEKKCADLEKNYSDEIYSQQSRKMSLSSQESEADISPGSLPNRGEDDRFPFALSVIAFTPDDLKTLKAKCTCLSELLENYNLDSLSNDDLKKLKQELVEHGFYESPERGVENGEKLRYAYEEKLATLHEQLENSVKVSSAIQEVGSSGEFEIGDLVQSYERRLQEQVWLAKVDIVATIESEIQRLAWDEGDEVKWPEDLLRLKQRFAERYEEQLKEQKKVHQQELESLCEKHQKALDKARRRSSITSLPSNESDLLKERETLKDEARDLRRVLGVLVKYFTDCEHTLNVSLVEELLCQVSKEGTLSSSDSSSLGGIGGFNGGGVHRVHLVPSNIHHLIDISNRRVSTDAGEVTSELDLALEQLRADSETLLALTVKSQKPSNACGDSGVTLPSDRQLFQLNRQIISQLQTIQELTEKLRQAESLNNTLEQEQKTLEDQLEAALERLNTIETELGASRERFARFMESGSGGEDVSQGYGAGFGTCSNAGGLKEAESILAELRERIAGMAATTVPAPRVSLALAEELCQAGERIAEAARREIEDFRLQVEVADRKYRALKSFVEEQTIEREQEREDARRELEQLKAELCVRDKERRNSQANAEQVEVSETQFRDAVRQLEEERARHEKTDAELKEAIRRVELLREVVRELETQIETRAVAEGELYQHLTKLQGELEATSVCTEQPDQAVETELNHLRDSVSRLENETQSLRVQLELAGDEGAQQKLQTQLNDFENVIDKRTKDLEGLHSTFSTTCCSSPSEDMSIREVMPNQNVTSSLEECQVPLQQLARLKDKLMRHSRAEDAAIKRIRDLEMQVFNFKADAEESQEEREVLRKQIADQLVLISSLQIRLDDQRIRAEHIEKQTNSSLELKIYSLQNEIVSLQEKLLNKDRVISQLNGMIEETRQRLRERETEISSGSPDELIVEMHMKLEQLQKENESLKMRIHGDSQLVPNLVENIISDKNSDIEKLRDRLNDTERQLEMYESLRLDKNQIDTLNRLRANGTSLENILCLLDGSSLEHVRRDAGSIPHHDSLSSLSLLQVRENMKTPIFEDSGTSEISRIEKLSASLPHMVNMKNSTEIQKSSEKRVRFADNERLQAEILHLRAELTGKEKIINEYSEKIQLLNNLEEKLANLQVSLDQTEQALTDATKTFEKEQETLKNSETNLRIELAEKKMHLEEREKQLDVYKEDSQRKDEMYIKLAKEKKDLEKRLGNSQAKIAELEETKKLLSDKDKEIDILEQQIVKLANSSSEDAENVIENLRKEIENAKSEMNTRENEIVKLKKNCKYLEKHYDEEREKNNKLKKDLNNNLSLINDKENEISLLQKVIYEKEVKLNEQAEAIENYRTKENQQKELLADRECELEILYEDIKRYQDEIGALEEKNRKLSNDRHSQTTEDLNSAVSQLKKKDAELENLTKEKVHLEELLVMKDRVIQQMSTDSQSLQVNLESIQSRILESGNVIELRQHLREEQGINAALLMEVHSLKARLLAASVATNENRDTILEGIEERVRRELATSALLDLKLINAIDGGDTNGGGSLDSSIDTQRALAEERRRIKELVISKQCLATSLKETRKELDRVQAEDADLLEKLRVKLDGALEEHLLLEQMLESEKMKRQELERRLEQETATHGPTANDGKEESSTSTTEYRILPSRNTHLEEEVRKLGEQIRTFKENKVELESRLKYTRDLADMKEDRLKVLELEVVGLKAHELELRTELQEKEKQMDNTRILLDEIGLENLELKKQNKDLKEANENLKKQFGDAMQEIISSGKELSIRSSKIRCLEKDLQQLKSQTNTETNPEVFDKINELKLQVQENSKMRESIGKLLSEIEYLSNKVDNLENPRDMNFTDPVNKASYLFARYLRAESYRKALVHQKLYLIKVILFYQQLCVDTPGIPNLLHPNHARDGENKSHRKSFRVYSWLVISIIRMRYLVVRWSTGKRLCKIPISSSAHRPFHLGQPVSTHHFMQTPILRTPVASGEPPILSIANTHDSWSGQSPPSKDRHTATRKNDADLEVMTNGRLVADLVTRFRTLTDQLNFNMAAPASIPDSNL